MTIPQEIVEAVKKIYDFTTKKNDKNKALNKALETIYIEARAFPGYEIHSASVQTKRAVKQACDTLSRLLEEDI